MMRNPHGLKRWDALLAHYLAHRRAFGRGHQSQEWILTRLRKYLGGIGATDLDAASFDQWRKSLRHLNPNTRYVREITVHQFCRYRRRTEPCCFVPDPEVFTRPRPHRLPMILTPPQIGQLLASTSALRWRASWHPAVIRLAIILLYTTGLRREELARLQLADVDVEAAMLRIREAKFHKSRWVPLSKSACRELLQYLQIRRTLPYGTSPAAPLLYNGLGTLASYTGTGLYHAVARLCRNARVLNGDGHPPRVVDFRHSFAVGALLRGYENGEDVQVLLPKLALYMGHVSIGSTAYYLRCMPAVIARASERFEDAYGALIKAGAA